MHQPLRYRRSALLRVATTAMLFSTGLLAGCGHGSSNTVLPSAGAATSSRTAAQAVTTTVNGYLAINVGGNASGTFGGDVDGNGGIPTSVSDTIDVSASNAGPVAVYQTQRYQPMTYTIPNLTPGATYTVRLHFAETYWGLDGRPGTGKRAFNVAVNGTPALTNFDVFTVAGGADKAVVRDVASAANGNGVISIALTNGTADNAMLNGIEIIASGAAAAAVPTSELPRASDAFVDSAGVNIHLSEYGTLYGNNFNAIQTLLSNANLRHVRDGVTAYNSAICGEYTSLAARGIHMNVLATWNAAEIAWWLSCVGSAAETLEGINEYDLSGDPNWAAALRANTLAIAAQFPHIPLIAPALTSEAAFATLGSLESVLSYGNAHAYFAGRNPGTTGWGGADGSYGSLAYNVQIVKPVSGTKPVIVTETGYSDQTDQYAVPPVTKARYAVRALLNNWNGGVPRTYFYELVDQGSPPFAHYGLVDASGNAKPAYTAVANLLGHLADPGGAFSPAPLNFAVNSSATVQHTLLQKHDGTYEIIVWNEVSEWNAAANASQPTTPQPVQIKFANAPSSVVQTTFGDSGTISTASIPTGTTVSTTAGAWPTILDIKP